MHKFDNVVFRNSFLGDSGSTGKGFEENDEESFESLRDDS